MKKILFFSVSALLFGLFAMVANADDLISVRNSDSEPVKLIFDTDMGNDVDDALALAIIHAMVDRGKCEFLGLTLTKSNLNAARYCKAFNIQYGHPDIPIGLVKDGKEPGDGRYVGRVLEIKKADGTPAFPVPDGWQPEDSVQLLRKLLAKAPDNSVVIAQVGFSTNLARLLDTPSDDISPLTGKELAEKKVRLVSAMAGAFTFPNNRFENHKEYNVVVDIPSAQKVFHTWPGEIVFSGFEVGVEIQFPGIALVADCNKREHEILKESYRFYRDGLEGKNQCTWDLTSVLFVVRPEAWRNYYTLSPKGNVTVLDDSRTRFAEDPNGTRRAFLCSPEQNKRIQEAFINLCTER